MSRYSIIKGFSRLSEKEKREVVLAALESPGQAEATLLSFHHHDAGVQQTLSGFSENTLSNFVLPFGVAPNFLINGSIYMVPMVVEESSVVAAAASAASYWAARGGFQAEVLAVEKTGQLHFLFYGDHDKFRQAEHDLFAYLLKRVRPITKKMEARGGGILAMEVRDLTDTMEDYFQLHVTFNTVDAMGANFINSVLEELGAGIQAYFDQTPGFTGHDAEPLMAILSNYTPNCLVRVSAACKTDALGTVGGYRAEEFARRFVQAMHIAGADVYRAVTHNKGIMNGIDAVVMATGNDFRAVEAGAHAFASRSGKYTSLSSVVWKEGLFRFTLEIPLALGTLGGLTRLHPLSALSLQILGNPSARELMMVVASAGLANNFAAVRSLVTSGIQAGHMRLHLPNLLQQHHANPLETSQAMAHFSDKIVSNRAVEAFLSELRSKK